MVLTYEPQRAYLVLLIAGLFVMGLVVLAGAGVGAVTRLRPARATDGDGDVVRPVISGRHRRHRVMSLTAGFIGLGTVGLLAGGPVVAIGAVAGFALASRPRWAQTATAAVLLGAVVALVIQVQRERQFPWDGIDLATGFGLALALASCVHLRRSTPHAS